MSAVSGEIIILGAGGEVPQYIEALELSATEKRIIGILDDNPQLCGTKLLGYEVLGPLDLACRMPNCSILWGLGNPTRPSIRLEIAHRLRLPSERFLTLIHPNAFVSRKARIDKGATILGGAYITAGVHVASHAAIGYCSLIEHESHIGPGSLVAGGVIIGGRVKVGAGSYLGQGCILKEQVRVGNMAIVGMGAAVLNDVADGQTVIGVPARPLKSRDIPPEFNTWLTATIEET